ncbi:MAG: MipA/OmpV family protein [Pseudomonadota bacterium]
MNKLFRTALTVTALSSIPCLVYAQGSDGQNHEGGGQKKWDITIGAGVFASPTYLGDDELQISVFPNIRVEYDDRFILGIDGAEFAVINTDNFRLGPVFRYDFGRDENGSNPLAVTNDDNTDLVGLGDIDGTPEFGGFLEYKFNSITTRIEARQGIDGHEGLVGEASVKYNHMFSLAGKSAFLLVGPSVTYGDDDYNSTYFDVSVAQALASGLSVYDADGGINSAGLEAALYRPLTDKVSVVLFADYDRLLGDIADSPLVEERGAEDQFTGGIFLNYRF